MNPMSSKLNHFLNDTPSCIGKRRHGEYFGIFFSAISGIAINIITIVIFLLAFEYELALLSIGGILNWCLSVFVLRKGQLDIAMYIGLFGMMLHVGVITWWIGTDYGAQMILWAGVAMTTLHNPQNEWLSKTLGILVLAQLMFMYAFFPEQTATRLLEGSESLFFAFVSLMAAGPLMFVSIRLKKLQTAQQKKLKQKVYNDDLTGLYNRYFVYELLEYELDNKKQDKVPYCLCFADVDHFKKVNDTYGHLVGDEVLVEIANTLKNSFRKSDIISRWGGEEFVIVLPGCELPEALKVIEKFQASLANKPISSEQMNITLSYGIVSLCTNKSIDDNLKQADELLYLAKQNGRNRIEVEQPPKAQ
jgi:diguanylate cyclase (GGDEF)-like protein